MSFSYGLQGQVQAPLHLSVIGGGLCGLATAVSSRLAGHRVTLLESVPTLREVGAGLHLTPNGTRLLRVWGVTAKLEAMAVTPDYIRMYRYNGTLLAQRTNYAAEIHDRYGSPVWCLHRADLQQAMVIRASELGVEIHLGTRVAHVDTVGNVRAVLESGECFEAEIVLCADGLWSNLKNMIPDSPVQPAPTGDLAYRILLDGHNLPSEELKEWVQNPGVDVWMGPGAHVVAYNIKGGRWLNLVLLVPDDLPENIRKADGDLNEMMKLFEGWDPLLTKLLNQTSKVEKWRLNSLSSLSRWSNPDGTFVIAGDCAHAMLPYMAQGADSALEDGATIGALLAKVQHKDQISSAMAMYDTIRRPRVNKLVPAIFEQGREQHLPDGEEQEKRDALLKRSMELEHETDKQEPWTHPKIQPWIFSYDAYAVVEGIYEMNPF